MRLPRFEDNQVLLIEIEPAVEQQRTDVRLDVAFGDALACRQAVNYLGDSHEMKSQVAAASRRRTREITGFGLDGPRRSVAGAQRAAPRTGEVSVHMRSRSARLAARRSESRRLFLRGRSLGRVRRAPE
jgi:hypothetical protein